MRKVLVVKSSTRLDDERCGVDFSAADSSLSSLIALRSQTNEASNEACNAVKQLQLRDDGSRVNVPYDYLHLMAIEFSFWHAPS